MEATQQPPPPGQPQPPHAQPQSPSAPAPHPGATDPTDVVGRRIGAALIDLLVLIALFVVFAILFGDTSTSDGEARANLNGAPAALFFLASLAYYAVTEALGGQTLGKRVLGIRVVRFDGSKAGLGPVLVRNVLRVVDGFFFYLVGFIVMMATGPKRQRVGDLAAGTRVVRA